MTQAALAPAPVVRASPTRAACLSGVRPCPWVRCRHHLYLEVRPNGSLHFPFGEVELDELRDTCALDVADRGRQSLSATAEAMGLSKASALNIEGRALMHLRIGADGLRFSPCEPPDVESSFPCLVDVPDEDEVQP